MRCEQYKPPLNRGGKVTAKWQYSERRNSRSTKKRQLTVVLEGFFQGTVSELGGMLRTNIVGTENVLCTAQISSSDL